MALTSAGPPHRQESTMARMNWDRVRKENQARRSGSEWIASGEQVSGLTAEPKPPFTRKVFSGRIPPCRMPGCACRKTTGFFGQHKKFCPLRKSPNPDVQTETTPNTARGEYPESIKKQLSAVSDFLSSLQSHMNAGTMIAEPHRKIIRKLIQVLQSELSDTSIVKSDL